MEGSHQNNLLLFSLLLQWKSIAFVFDLAWWFSKEKDYGYIFISSFKIFTQPLNLKAKKSYFLKIAMSVSLIGLDLFPWFIFVCIHFPGIFSWISPVTLRTCIQCWWQKTGIKISKRHPKDGDVAVSSVSSKRHTSVSYTLYHILLNIFWNLRYTTAKICGFIKTGETYFFSGEVKVQGCRNH